MSAALKMLYVVLPTTFACVVMGIGTYPAAAVMAGTGVAAVGVNRSITGGCWGACQVHWRCERDSGLCVPPPCRDECHFDEVCENDRCILRHREQPGAANDDIDGGPTPLETDGGA
jgi:hypothetical protein